MIAAMKRSDMQERARMAGLTFETYSPGDGVTRYRFFRLSDGVTDYFAGDGVITVLGRADAALFIAGALEGYNLAMDSAARMMARRNA